MAKSRRNRSGAARRDPIAKPVKPPSDPELAALREAKILPVIKDLKSADPKSRSAAATAVSNIIQDTRCRKLLLREQIVHTILTETLTDAALESRAAGWGILQVLAQEEEADFCIHLFRSDVLTAIEFASKQICERIAAKQPALAKTPKAEQATVASIASSLVSLLTALAEAGDDILAAISSNATITRFIAVLVAYGGDAGTKVEDIANIRADALACLMILCEDNDKLAQDIVASQDSACYSTLQSLKDQPDGEGVLSCAVLHNIFTSLLESTQGQLPTGSDDSSLIPTLSKAVASFSSDQPSENAASGWSNPAEYQQLALETLASIGTSLTANIGGPIQTSSHKGGHKRVEEAAGGDEDDEAMDDAEDGDEAGQSGDENDDDADADADGMDEDNEMTQEEMEADMDMVTGAASDDEDQDNIDDLPILKALLQSALPQLIRISAAQPTDEASMSMQGHALSALNNIAWSISLFDFTDDHNAGIQNAWSPVAKAIWQQVITPILASDTADLGLATQLTSLSWAVARALRSKTPLQPGEHAKFITLYQATKGDAAAAAAAAAAAEDDPFQSLGVKCIGVLGQLALYPCATDLNREIGTFLVTVVASLPQTPAADAVEALNQLFDVYGNEDFPYDKDVFWANNFVKHLDDAVPKARSMAKSVDKKTQSELRLRADEAVMNLTRFLAYKKKHSPAN